MTLAIKDKNGKINAVILIGIIALIVTAFLVLYSVIRISTDKSSLNEYSSDIPEGIIYDVEGGSVFGDGHGELAGYLVDSGTQYSIYDYALDSCENDGIYNYIVCGITDKNKVIRFKTKWRIRTDVNDKLNNGIDYKNCGFQAYVPVKYVKENADSEVVLITKRYEEEEVLIHTGKSLGEFFKDE